MVCGNVGDSRCVIGSKGRAISMTDDHKAENPEEKARVEAAGDNQHIADTIVLLML